ncbi:MAG: hypothetical protein NC483_05650 [Ruminococcus sp.]|nr:hypothetical protein [Ruminococcus sp.]
MICKNKTYIDVTKEMIDQANPNSHEIIEDNRYYKGDDGSKYYVDGSSVIYSPSIEEIENANWLSKTFGGKIRIQSKVNSPKYIKCSDYRWQPIGYPEEKWDLKTLGEKATTRAVDNNLKKARGQSQNFILKIKKDCPLTTKNVINQVKRLYDKQDRKWVDKIIIRKEDTLIAIYIRK